MKRLICICLLVCCISDATSAAPAVPQSKKQALNQVKSELEHQKSQVTHLKQTETDIKAELARLQKDLIETAHSVREQEQRLASIEAKLERLDANIAQQHDILLRDQAMLGALVTALSRLSRLPPEALLARQATPIHAARSASLLKTAIPHLEKQATLLKQKLSALRQQEQTLKSEKRKHTAEQDRLKQKTQRLDLLIAQRSKFYDKTYAQRKQNIQKVNSLARQAENLQDLIYRLDRPAPGHKPSGKTWSNGQLPLSGTITVAFGKEDEFGTHSKGIYIQGRKDGTVIAPLDGVVRFAGPFQSYKQILIIEHEGEYHSLIAGLSRITTVVGERVLAGEPIGTANSPPNGKSSLIYYELRHNGKPVNPQRHITTKG